MAAKTTKAEYPTPNSTTPPVDLLRFDGSLAPVWTRPIEAWLHWQADVLKAAGLVASGWFERRREATQATLEAIEKLSHCTNPNEAAALQRDWLDGSLKRLTSDFEALTEHATILSRETVALTRSATPLARVEPKGTQVDAAA